MTKQERVAIYIVISLTIVIVVGMVAYVYGNLTGFTEGHAYGHKCEDILQQRSLEILNCNQK